MINYMVHTLFLDLDGTLLRNDKSLSSFTIETLEKLKSAGLRLIFATARPPRAVYRTFSYPFESETVILYNGSEIHQSGVPVYRKFIPERAVRFLIQACRKYSQKLVCGFEKNDWLISSGDFDRHFSRKYYDILDDLEALAADSPKFLVDLPDEKALKFVREIIPDDCALVVTDGGTLAQIVEKSVSKKQAAEFLLSESGKSPKDCLCMGDDYNDMELFRTCGVSVCMGNGIQELKEIASFTAGSNDADGAANFLREYFKVQW